MKTKVTKVVATLCLAVFVSSCSIYEHTYVVGKGSQTAEVIQNKNILCLTETKTDSKIKNYVFQLSLGFLF